MADRLFMADSAFPGFTGQETQEEKLQRILDYLYQLNEQYRYILCQLNIDETDTEDSD
jgi:hypothetical protein